MKVQVFEYVDGLGEQIKTLGIRKVAREANLNPSYLSELVNNKRVTTQTMIKRLEKALKELNN